MSLLKTRELKTLKSRERFHRQNSADIAVQVAPQHRAGHRNGACGFTLLEVLVSLTVLAIGLAIVLSLISGSLGSIRKVQSRTRTVEHAEAVMEIALLNDSISQPTTFNGNFEDGTRWSVRVEDYSLPSSDLELPRNAPQNMPVKLLCYTVEMFSPDSNTSDYQLQTLKLVRETPGTAGMRVRP